MKKAQISRTKDLFASAIYNKKLTNNMKNKIFLCCIITLMLQMIYLPSYAQSYTENYIVTERFLNERGTRRSKSIQYCDGLGRPTVFAVGGVNTSGKFVYSMTEYDMYGIERKSWQPAIGTTSPDIIDVTKMASMSRTTYDGETCGYSEMKYDVLGRNVFKGTPGALWIGKGIKTEYITNNDSIHPVRKYELNEYGCPKLNSGYYKSCSLDGVRTTDEDGHVVEVYKDLLGNVVLERRDGNNDTYYVYENGLLRAVVPPLWQRTNESSLLYRYKYDSYGRCVERKLPGCQSIKYWYDKYGRIAFMQDALTGRGKYRFYLYDGLNRLVVQGITSDISGKDNCEKYVAKVVFGNEKISLSNTGYYFDGDFSMSDVDIEIVNYYDGYECLDYFDSFTSKYNLPTSSNDHSYSKLTAQIVKTSNRDRICRIMFYDKKGRCYSSYTTYPDDVCKHVEILFVYG